MGKTRKRGRRIQALGQKQPQHQRPTYEVPPKAGPGQVLAEQQFAEAGIVAPRKRIKNHGEHPLTLAYSRGQLASRYGASVPPAFRITAEERLDAGENYRELFEKRARTGRDSLDMSVAAGGGSRTPWTDAQARAIREVKKLEEKMHPRDRLIVRCFCGEGHSMVDSLRMAGVDFHPNGVTYRIREALDELVAATTGRKVIPPMQDVA